MSDKKPTKAELRALKKFAEKAAKVCSSVVAPIQVGEVEIDEYGTVVAEVHGGINGRGRWTNYFTVLSNFSYVLQNYYGITSWLINVDNDTLDDVFYAKFGIRFMPKNLYEKGEDSDDVESDLYDIAKLMESEDPRKE